MTEGRRGRSQGPGRRRLHLHHVRSLPPILQHLEHILITGHIANKPKPCLLFLSVAKFPIKFISCKHALGHQKCPKLYSCQGCYSLSSWKKCQHLFAIFQCLELLSEKSKVQNYPQKPAKVNNVRKFFNFGSSGLPITLIQIIILLVMTQV